MSVCRERVECQKHHFSRLPREPVDWLESNAVGPAGAAALAT